MTVNSSSPFFHKKPSKTPRLVWILMILLVPGIAYFMVSKGISQFFQVKPDDFSAKPTASLKDIGDGWWEAEDFIYHGIPTRIVFQMPPETEQTPEQINAAAWQEFDRIGKIFNPFDPASEVSHLNSLIPRQTIPVSKDIYAVIRLSRALWNQTSGNFDPTLWSLKQLWQTAEKTQRIPDDTDISAALEWIGLDHVRMIERPERALAFGDHPVQFDFGGIVKGYAVDQVREILLNAGIRAGLVQLGGEVSAFGSNNGNPWRIGIQHPKEMDKVWGVIASDADIRVSTSGNYRQPIRINGKSFYHIFSPKTGWPVSEKVLGVTTVDLKGTTESARLDGIATAITVMGPENGFALAVKLGIDAVILYEKNDGGIGEYVTRGLSGVYEKKPR